MWIAGVVIFTQVVTVIVLNSLFFRCYCLTRPPIGVLNLGDVAVILAAILLTPYLYLALPAWLVTVLLGVGLGNLLYLVWEPILSRPLLVWCATVAPLGADLAVAWHWGGRSIPFFVVNNFLLLVAVVGIANLWAQSGFSARNVAILAGTLAVYDFVFTTQLPLMADLFQQLGLRPFAPMLAWMIDQAPGWMGLGLGDLIFAAAPPLVLHKAFGWRAGASAGILGMLAIGCVLLLPLLGVRAAAFPVMVVLGPAIVAHYFYWLHAAGVERTTWQYRQRDTGCAAPHP
jgi:hypothetical protein